MRKLLPVIFALLITGFYKPVFAADPHLYLSPTSGNQSGGFNVEVRVDTGGQSAGGVDVYLSYPADLLNIDNFTKGTAFSEIYNLIKNDEGKLRVFAYFPSTQAGSSYNGTNGLVGTIRFNALKTSGTAAVSFLCTSGQTNESNIVAKTTSQDVIVCSANVGGNYTLVSSGGNTSTPTPTTAAGSSPTPTLPVSGIAEYTFGLLGLGLVILLTGLVLSI